MHEAKTLIASLKDRVGVRLTRHPTSTTPDITAPPALLPIVDEGNWQLREESPPSEPKTVEELLLYAYALQQRFSMEGVSTLLAGGVAAEVLANEALPGHEMRVHKDIDIVVPSKILRSCDHLMIELGYQEFQFPVDHERELHLDLIHGLSHTTNLSIFYNPEGVRVDLMGYWECNTASGVTTEFPLLSWGKIDTMKTPVPIDVDPVKIPFKDDHLNVLSPGSLLRLKSVEQTEGDATKNKERDITLLQKLVDDQFVF